MKLLRRILRHLATPAYKVGRAFPPPVQSAVEAAVRNLETSHDVVLKVVAEANLPLPAIVRGQTARQRAIELFSLLRVWDTERNCGVLLYVQLADQRIDIVADRGIDAKVEQAEWDAICSRIAAAFRDGRFEEGAMLGIREISALIMTHVPPRDPAPPAG